MESIFITLTGILLKPILKYFPVKKKLWLFGAQDGQAYVDNSKYLFEYVVKQESAIKAVWITRSRKVFEELSALGMPVKYNLSLVGLWYVIRAEIIAFSTSRNDVLFIHPKKGRKIINLWHGMPIKKIVYDYEPHKTENKSLKAKIWDFFVAGFQHRCVDIIVSTSPFFSEILKSSFRNNNIYVTGQPRTDAFYMWDKKAIKAKMGFKEGEIIITYMPTHRAYGKGKMNPKIFENNDVILDYFQNNNVKLVWKYHKNMLQNFSPVSSLHTSIIDLTTKNTDPQELLFITDLLITDYSSCYIDFLLLNRPIVFYHYDDYEESDNALYFSIKENNPGPIVDSENELSKLIVKLLIEGDSFLKQREEYLNLYHTYKDGHSSKRVFEIISEM